MRRRGANGQSTILVLAVVVMVGAIALALVGLGSESVRRGRLQAAADVTALAAAHGTEQGVTVAARNDVEIIDVEQRPDGSVAVTVEQDGRRAVASATVRRAEVPRPE